MRREMSPIHGMIRWHFTFLICFLLISLAGTPLFGQPEQVKLHSQTLPSGTDASGGSGVQGLVFIDFPPSPIGTPSEEPSEEEGCWIVCITFLFSDCSTPLAGIIDFAGPSFPFELIDVQVVNGLTCEGTPTSLPVAVDDGEAVSVRFRYTPQAVDTAFDAAIFNSDIVFDLAGGTLDIDTVELEQPGFPSGQPVPVEPQTDVVDSTPVRFKITIANTSFVDAAITVDIADPETGDPLPGGPLPYGVIPGQYLAEALFTWDTEGFAWDGDMPRTFQDVEISIPFDMSTDFDMTTETVGLQPRPVFLVHGFRSNSTTWAGFPQYFQGLHSNWSAFAVNNMNTGGALNDALTYPQNAQRLNTYIRNSAAGINAWNIDLLAHSMGGLISRQYVHSFMPRVAFRNNAPLVKSLLMMGTPHLGSACADRWGGGGVPLLRPNFLTAFNQQVTNRKNVAFSALAGNPSSFFLCSLSFVANDGWVTVPSATFNIADTTLDPVEHTEMTDENQADVTDYVEAELVPAASPFGTPEGLDTRTSPLRGSDTFDGQLILDQDVTLGVGQTVTIPFSVPPLDGMSVWFPFDPQLGVILRNPSNVPSGTLETAVFVARIDQAAPAPGTWSLELTNNTGESGDFPISVWVEGYPFQAVLETVELQADTFRLVATLTNGGTPVPGAAVQAELRSFPVSDPIVVDLLDDGASGDGAAGDGVYAATVGPLPDLGELATYGIRLHSAGPGFELFTVGDLSVTVGLFSDGFETGDTANWAVTDPAPPSLLEDDESGTVRVLRPLQVPTSPRRQ